MAGQWYWVDGTEVYGPISKKQLVSFVKRGGIVPATQVRNGESGPWRRAEDVPGLFREAFAPPPRREQPSGDATSSPRALLGLILGGVILSTALVTATVCYFVFAIGSGDETPVVEESVAVNEETEEQRDEENPFGVEPAYGGDERAVEPKAVEKPQQTQVPVDLVEVSPKKNELEEPEPPAELPLGNEPKPPVKPAPVIVESAPQPEFDPKPLLPPIPDVKLPILDREISDFHNTVRWERKATDGYARYEVFSQTYEFTEEQQERVNEELAEWKYRADKNLYRLGTEWVSLEELKNAERESEQILERALTLLEAGSIDEVIDLLDQASRANPNGIKPDYLLGLIYSLPHAGPLAPDRAEYHFDMVLRRHSDHPAALNSLAIAQIKQRQYGSAFAKLSRAAELIPECQEVSQNLGRFIMLAESGRISVPKSVLNRYEELYATLITDGRARPFDPRTGYLHMIPVFPSHERDDSKPQTPDAPRAAGEFVAHFTGSGFVVAPGYIVTNRHVVFDEGGLGVADAIGVLSPDEPDRELRGTVVAISDATDLAIVHAPGFDAPQLRLRESEVDLASDVMILGFPQSLILGVGLKATRGVVAALPDPTRGGTSDFYLFDATADKGNSGGPVFDKYGEVVAVLTMGYRLDADLSGGVTSGAVREFLRESLPDLEFHADDAREPFGDWSELTKKVSGSVLRLVCYYEAGGPAVNIASRAGRHAFEDRTCPSCNGSQQGPCSNRQCKGGEVSEYYFVRMRVGQTFTRQRKSRRVPCSTCNGLGRIDCRHCSNGYDSSLGR